jgi:hypothetical protein
MLGTVYLESGKASSTNECTSRNMNQSVSV